MDCRAGELLTEHAAGSLEPRSIGTCPLQTLSLTCSERSTTDTRSFSQDGPLLTDRDAGGDGRRMSTMTARTGPTCRTMLLWTVKCCGGRVSGS